MDFHLYPPGKAETLDVGAAGSAHQGRSYLSHASEACSPCERTTAGGAGWTQQNNILKLKLKSV